MQRLPSIVEGVSVESDLRAERWLVRFGGRQLQLREWTWGERRRLVFHSMFHGRISADRFVDGLFELLADTAPDVAWRDRVVIVALGLLGVPLGGPVRPLRAGEFALARSLGWLPEVLDRQLASAVDSLLDRLSETAPTGPDPGSNAAEEGWNRIVVGESNPQTSRLSTSGTTGTEETGVLADAVPDPHATLSDLMTRMVEVIAFWAGIPGTAASGPPSYSPASTDSTTQVPALPVAPVHDKGSTPPPFRSTTVSPVSAPIPAGQESKHPFEKGTVPGTVRLRPRRNLSAPARLPSPVLRVHSGGAPLTSPDPIPESAKTVGERAAVERGPRREDPAIRAAARHAAGEPGAGSVEDADRGPGPTRVGTTSNPLGPRAALVSKPMAESSPTVPIHPRNAPWIEGASHFGKPIAWEENKAKSVAGEAFEHARKQSAFAGGTGRTRVSDPFPGLASEGDFPRHRKAARIAAGVSGDAGLEFAAENILPKSGKQAEAKSAPDPFAASELEEELADVLERAALEAGIDLP